LGRPLRSASGVERISPPGCCARQMVVDKEERLRRIVRGNRREAALKGWDTRRAVGKPSPTEVDADSKSVANVLHGDEETGDT
jgi:hypothetical protein